MALDWPKAFDSISPKNLVHALRRFGLPCATLCATFTKGRRFTVRDWGHQSRPHAQQFGISQGCPLSPVLFSMLMTVRISANYGLLFNWRKLEVLPVGCDAFISKPDGQFIECKGSVFCLGAVLAADGSVGSEVNRRLGLARADFLR